MADLIGYESSMRWKECVELVSTIASYGQLLEQGGMGSLSFGIMPVMVGGKLKSRNRKCCRMFETGIDITLD